MAKYRRPRDFEDVKVDMTPMLDIIFIMLIFFIVTTSFVKESGLDVKSLEANTNTKSNAKNITISIDESGVIIMNGRYIDISRVEANIQSFIAENNTRSALVRAQQATEHGTVVTVIDKIKAVGISEVAVMRYD